MREGGDDPELLELMRFGKVAEVDLAARRCTVDTGELTTAPVRWLAPRAGATKAWSPPSVGEQVLLFCPGGEFTAAVALLGLESDANQLPGDSLKELIQFADGAVLSYDPEAHALEAALPAGATARIAADGGITLVGDVTITGDLLVEGDSEGQGNVTVQGSVAADDDVTAGSISLQQHKHGGVQAGGGQTGLPL